MKSVAVVGGGASGCFCAVNIKKNFPDIEVTVYEAGPVPMAKLSVTGGGRCNITNSFAGVSNLKDVYPRGFNLMKRVLPVFGPEDTRRWFEGEGVILYEQPDGRLFPVSNDASEVVGTLSDLMDKYSVKVCCMRRVTAVRKEEQFILDFQDGDSAAADSVVVTSGGGTSGIVGNLGIKIIPPVPSLFTFRIEDESLCSLMGSTVENAILSLPGTGFRSSGQLLMTDWGISGPAVLRLSSYAARHLADIGYRTSLIVNWTGEGEKETELWLHSAISGNGRRTIGNVRPDGISGRIWKHLLMRSGVREDLRCSEMGTRSVNRIIATITSDRYEITGRCRFKEEFVTCGGVALSAVNPVSMEARECPGLFFAGEVLDVDAVTGGFNLQAAWSTSYIVSGKIISYICKL